MRIRTRLRKRRDMFAQLTSASPYADIIFFVIIAAGLILGLIRGFSKSFKGFFLAIAILLISLLLLSATFAPIRDWGMFISMEESITDSIEDKTDLFARPIYMLIDAETGEVTYSIDIQLDDGTTQRVSLDDGIDNLSVESVKARFALWLADKFIEEDGQTLGEMGGIFIADCIVAGIVYIFYCVIFGLLGWLLRKIFKNMRKSDNAALKTIDRIAGCIVSAGFACVFALLILAILYALRDKTGVVNEALANSPVCGPLYANNPISVLFKQIFG